MRLVLAMLVFYSTYQFINMAQPMPPTPTTPGAPVNWPIPVLDEGQEYHCFIAYSFKEQEIGKFITYSFHHEVSLIKMLTWSCNIGYTKQFLLLHGTHYRQVVHGISHQLFSGVNLDKHPYTFRVTDPTVCRCCIS